MQHEPESHFANDNSVDELIHLHLFIHLTFPLPYACVSSSVYSPVSLFND